MKSIKSNFKQIQNKIVGIGAIPALAIAVSGKGFNQDSITRAFTKLVPKDEYVNSERRALIKHLTNLSNSTEDDKIMAKNEREHILNDVLDLSRCMTRNRLLNSQNQ